MEKTSQSNPPVNRLDYLNKAISQNIGMFMFRKRNFSDSNQTLTPASRLFRSLFEQTNDVQKILKATKQIIGNTPYNNQYIKEYIHPQEKTQSNSINSDENKSSQIIKRAQNVTTKELNKSAKAEDLLTIDEKYDTQSQFNSILKQISKIGRPTQDLTRITEVLVNIEKEVRSINHKVEDLKSSSGFLSGLSGLFSKILSPVGTVGAVVGGSILGKVAKTAGAGILGKGLSKIITGGGTVIKSVAKPLGNLMKKISLPSFLSLGKKSLPVLRGASLLSKGLKIGGPVGIAASVAAGYGIDKLIDYLGEDKKENLSQELGGVTDEKDYYNKLADLYKKEGHDNFLGWGKSLSNINSMTTTAEGRWDLSQNAKKNIIKSSTGQWIGDLDTESQYRYLPQEIENDKNVLNTQTAIQANRYDAEHAEDRYDGYDTVEYNKNKQNFIEEATEKYKEALGRDQYLLQHSKFKINKVKDSIHKPVEVSTGDQSLRGALVESQAKKTEEMELKSHQPSTPINSNKINTNNIVNNNYDNLDIRSFDISSPVYNEYMSRASHFWSSD